MGLLVLYRVAGTVALFEDIRFIGRRTMPTVAPCQDPSNKLSMLYHHTKVRIPIYFFFTRTYKILQYFLLQMV